MSLDSKYRVIRDSNLGTMIKCSPTVWRNLEGLGAHCTVWEMQCMKVIRLKGNRHLAGELRVVNGYKCHIPSGKTLMRVSGIYYTNTEWKKLPQQREKVHRTVDFGFKGHYIKLFLSMKLGNGNMLMIQWADQLLMRSLW